MGKGKSFQQMVLEKNPGYSHAKKVKLDPCLTPYIKINKVNQRPKCRAKTLKLLERKHRGKIHDVGFDNDILDMTPQVKATKEKIRLDWKFQTRSFW